ncbi:hypothetical protein [Caballeronia sp. TF1N1]|uniref:hypothetical protein n=1 Tax=Caballeronia sp. TF1N1 TaxID=2878153 RepID=UPI001FD54243|nr:hypothetical protein [Caballeronia sp. TF1N1]
MATTPNYGVKIISKAVQPAIPRTTVTPITVSKLNTPPHLMPINIAFARFDDDGRIEFVGHTSPEGWERMLGYTAEYVVQGDADVDLDWVDGHVIKRRPENPTILDGMTLRNLPIPCQITVDGTTHDSQDETADLSFSQPGTYTVVVSAFPMLDASFQVTQE